MKTIIKSGLLCAVLFSASCSDKIDAPYIPAAGQGEDVVFKFEDVPQSRTMYSDEWDATSTQDIWWGNYLPDVQGEDQVKIFCKAGAVEIATYDVNKQETNSNVAESVTKATEVGVQWGQEGVTHNFYAFYPASAAGDAFVGSGDNTIRATVATGQSPVTYKAVVANGTTWTDNALVSVAANSTKAVENATTIYGQPDMSAAIMVAKTSVSGTPDAATQTGYGYPVPLHFNVLADVLDLTLNGPVIPNTLGGNEANKARDFITINSVRVESKNGSTVISGNFDLNMQTGKATNVSGNTSILLQTAQVTQTTTQRPVLYARYDTGDDGKPTAAQVDHLRLRAFLIPGQVKDLSELRVVLSTDCGEYTQELGSSTIATGKIHPIKLGYFRQRGTEFDFSNWMAQLDPNIYISELSIPGTWHSAISGYQGSSYTDFQTQYKAGIRAFEAHVDPVAGDDNYKIGEYSSPETSSVLTNNIRSDSNPTPVRNTSNRTCTRTVTITRTTTTTTTAPIEGYKLKLVRHGTTTDMATSLTSLKSLINSGAFIVVEFGMNYSGKISIPVSVTKTEVSTQTATVTQTGTYSGNYSYTYSWDTNLPTPAESDWSSPTVTSSTQTTNNETLNASQAWVKGVSDLCFELAEAGVVYADEITPNTTISDVSGKIIIKVNTNNTDNETGWPAKTPALFSRWQFGSKDTPLTIGLNWGQPASETVSANPMQWCFIEVDNHDQAIVSATLEDRETAINNMNAISYENYIKGLHNTWYECQIGGYIGAGDGKPATAATCQNVATELNPYLIQVLSNPNRQACPLGLIYMNYALDATYSGPELIRTIINNNAAFILARRSSNSSDNTNSSFVSKPGNAVK